VDVFPPAERGRALGMVGTVVAGGLTMGPALGGMLLQFFPWPVIFYINVPVGVAAARATLKVLRRESEIVSPETFDWPGSILLVVCFTAFLILLSRGGEFGYASSLALAACFCFRRFVSSFRKDAHATPS
jgi:MFS family permease